MIGLRNALLLNLSFYKRSCSEGIKNLMPAYAAELFSNQFMVLFVLFFISVTPSNHAQDFWYNTMGPYQPVADPITALAVDTNGYIYTGGPMGVSRSTDNGESWQQTSLYNVHVRSLFITKHNMIYAGSDRGLCCSSDAGASWSAIDNPKNEGINSIFVSETGKIFLCIDRLIVSNNNGLTWATVTSIPGGSGTTIYAILKYNDSKIFLGSSAGGYQSNDTGRTWFSMTQLGSKVTAIAVNDSGHIFVTASSANIIYRSTDVGGTWIAQRGTPGYFYSIATGPNGTVFAGSDRGVEVSTDNGNTWQNRSSGLPGMNVYSIVALKSGLVLSGTAKGIGRTSDAGIVWERKNEGFISPAPVYSMCFDSSGRFYAGTNKGVYSTPAGYEDWEERNNGLPPSPLIRTLHYSTSGYLFAGTDSGIYRSSDLGMNWTSANNGLNPQKVGFICSNYPSKIFIGTEAGVYLSIDNGSSWTSISTGVMGSLKHLVLSKSGKLYYQGSRIFESTDDGQSWNQVMASTENLTVVNTQGVVFSIFFVNDLEFYWTELKRSTNFGANWLKLNYHLGWRAIFLECQDRTNDLIWGCESFVVINKQNSNEAFQTSEYYTGKLLAAASDPAGNLYIGTQRGIYKSITSRLTASEQEIPSGIPSSTHLQQNYPNPFNPVTTITYSISPAPSLRAGGAGSLRNGMAGEEFVSLKVYDVLGNEVTTLVNEEKPVGEYRVAFSGANLPSGIYFYRLTAGKYSETKKMSLLK